VLVWNESSSLQVGRECRGHLLKHFGVLLLELVVLIRCAVDVLEPLCIGILTIVKDSTMIAEVVASLIKLAHLIFKLEKPRCPASVHLHIDHLARRVKSTVFLNKKLQTFL
jgi:hypothetical protein